MQLAAHGVRSIELTLRPPDTLEHLSSLLARRSVDVEIGIGIGIIVSMELAQRAIDAGADYVVTPALNLIVIALAVDS